MTGTWPRGSGPACAIPSSRWWAHNVRTCKWWRNGIVGGVKARGSPGGHSFAGPSMRRWSGLQDWDPQAEGMRILGVALDEVGREPVDRLPRGWFEHSAARLSSPSAGEHLARVYSGLAPVRSARRAVQQPSPRAPSCRARPAPSCPGTAPPLCRSATSCSRCENVEVLDGDIVCGHEPLRPTGLLQGGSRHEHPPDPSWRPALTQRSGGAVPVISPTGRSRHRHGR